MATNLLERGVLDKFGKRLCIRTVGGGKVALEGIYSSAFRK